MGLCLELTYGVSMEREPVDPESRGDDQKNLQSIVIK
jgi:hypothetical protein